MKPGNTLDKSPELVYNDKAVNMMQCAGITQLVEYLTRNEEVEGSSPFSSSLLNGSRKKFRLSFFRNPVDLNPRG